MSRQIANSAQGPEERLLTIRAFFRDRRITNYVSVFKACGLDLDEHKVRAWFNGRLRVTDGDVPTIARMEKVVAGVQKIAN